MALRVIGVIPEQAAQQHSLGVGGVLVLIQHDHAEAVTLGGADGSMLTRKLCCHGHLLVKRHNTTGTQFCCQFPSQIRIGGTDLLSIHPFLHGLVVILPRLAAWQGSQVVNEGGCFLLDAVRRIHLIAHGVHQRQKGIHHRVHRRVLAHSF